MIRFASFFAGVYTADIDARQNKVTVTGNVDAETLLKKLLRSGKHAELCPENFEKQKNKNPAKSKKKGELKEFDHQDGNDVSEDIDEDIIDQNAEVLGKLENLSVSDVKGSENIEVVNGSGGGGDGGGGGKKKKKKKKGQNSNSENFGGSGQENLGDGTAAVATESPAVTVGPPALPVASTNHGPPLPQEHPYPPPAYYAPPLAFGVSYNTSHPGASAATSYYPPPMTPMHSYSFYQPGGYVPPPPSDPIRRFEHDRDHLDDDQSGFCSVM